LSVVRPDSKMAVAEATVILFAEKPKKLW